MTLGDDVDLHALDAAYVPFPPVIQWLEQTRVDSARWERYTGELEQLRPATDVLQRARQIAKRAAAIDTGAIEGLYDVDRGFTFTVATEAVAWEVALASKGENVRSLFEAQLHAYDYVLDLATKAQPVSEAAIRELHVQVCAAQHTYRVMTAVGPQEQPLPKGEYKALPNHVRTRKGMNHSYAPVDVTPHEMMRLVGELRSAEFLAAHPIVQAAYAHYALVVVHPFADGNGRVARALCSVYTYRAASMPIVILAEHKHSYLDALEATDRGDYQAFVTFLLTRALDTLVLVQESIRAASAPPLASNLSAITGLYITRGGFTHEDVDAAGEALLAALAAEYQRILSEQLQKPLTSNVAVQSVAHRMGNPAYRAPIKGHRGLVLSLGSPLPAMASVSRIYALELPRDAAGDDDIVISRTDKDETFTARIDEVIPSVSGILQIRARMFAERVVAEMVAALLDNARASLNKLGR